MISLWNRFRRLIWIGTALYVAALLTAPQRVDAEVEKIVGRLSLEPTISAARWQADVQLDPEGRAFPHEHSDDRDDTGLS